MVDEDVGEVEHEGRQDCVGLGGDSPGLSEATDIRYESLLFFLWPHELDHELIVLLLDPIEFLFHLLVLLI